MSRRTLTRGFEVSAVKLVNEQGYTPREAEDRLKAELRAGGLGWLWVFGNFGRSRASEEGWPRIIRILTDHAAMRHCWRTCGAALNAKTLSAGSAGAD